MTMDARDVTRPAFPTLSEAEMAAEILTSNAGAPALSLVLDSLRYGWHDPAHCLAGLFLSLAPGDYGRGKLDLTYLVGSMGESIRFRGPDPLGAPEMRVLQALTALTRLRDDGGNRTVVGEHPISPATKVLRRNLRIRRVNYDDPTPAIFIRTSLRQLVALIGHEPRGGGGVRATREALERLASVTIVFRSAPRAGKRRRVNYNLLAAYESEEGGANRVHVALNPRLTLAILGQSPHAVIDLREVRELPDPAAILHQRLCGWVDPGAQRQVALDTMCNYIWGDTAVANTQSQHRTRARNALAEIASVGWSVEEYAPERFTLGRPPIEGNPAGAP
jgi:hypothetical protein